MLCLFFCTSCTTISASLSILQVELQVTTPRTHRAQGVLKGGILALDRRRARCVLLVDFQRQRQHPPTRAPIVQLARYLRKVQQPARSASLGGMRTTMCALIAMVANFRTLRGSRLASSAKLASIHQQQERSHLARTAPMATTRTKEGKGSVNLVKLGVFRLGK